MRALLAAGWPILTSVGRDVGETTEKEVCRVDDKMNGTNGKQFLMYNNASSKRRLCSSYSQVWTLSLDRRNHYTPSTTLYTGVIPLNSLRFLALPEKYEDLPCATSQKSL